MTHNRSTLRILGRALSVARSITMLQIRALALMLGCSHSHLRAVFFGKRRSPRIESDPRFIALRASELPHLEYVEQQRRALFNPATTSANP